jgi:hypothetical protein
MLFGPKNNASRYTRNPGHERDRGFVERDVS